MERQHDTEHRAEQADIWRIGCYSPDHDQTFGQRDFKFLHILKLAKVNFSEEDPPFHRDCDGPDAE